MKTLNALKDEVKIPTAIANDSGILPNQMSKVLKELKDEDIAECINHEVQKGRLYRFTKTGETIAEYLK